MHDLLDVNRHAVIDKITVLRIGHSANIESFQYQTPHQNRTFAKNSDWSGHHIAFYVRDIDAAVKYMERRGVEKFRTVPGDLCSGERADDQLLQDPVRHLHRVHQLPAR